MTANAADKLQVNLNTNLIVDSVGGEAGSGVVLPRLPVAGRAVLLVNGETFGTGTFEL